MSFSAASKTFDDLNGLIQALECVPQWCRTGFPYARCSASKPARANAENETTAGCMIESRGYLARTGGCLYGVARHEHADFDPARLQGKAGQRGPCFEAWTGRFAEDREKMIEHPCSVIAGLIDGLPNRDSSCQVVFCGGVCTPIEFDGSS